MTAARVTIVQKYEGWKCERCAHTWKQRGQDRPRICPKCKSASWDIPKKRPEKGKKK